MSVDSEPDGIFFFEVLGISGVWQNRAQGACTCRELAALLSRPISYKAAADTETGSKVPGPYRRREDRSQRQSYYQGHHYSAQQMRAQPI